MKRMSSHHLTIKLVTAALLAVLGSHFFMKHGEANGRLFSSSIVRASSFLSRLLPASATVAVLRAQNKQGAPLDTYTVTNTASSGAGSLRQAILDANSRPGLDMIVFSVGSGQQTISPGSGALALPSISDPLVIDGTTQPGYAGTPIIVLNGSSAGGGANGLFITAGSSTVKGLVINRFSGNGIRMSSAGGNNVENCYIGTNIAGTAAGPGNGDDGVELVSSPDNTIGGTVSGQGNVISGNGSAGIRVTAGSTGTTLQGNLIGTNAAGTAAIGNSEGIVIGSSNNIVGGVASGAGNIISGNSNAGIVIIGGSSNQIQGNYIGTNAAGTPLGNGIEGIRLNASSNSIGGTSAGGRNIIAFNGLGVLVDSGSGNAIRGNSIYANEQLGIDLSVGIGANGVTANDAVACDPDTGANNLQNFPVITSAINITDGLRIEGTLNSSASTNFALDFFSNSSCDPSGNGEGQTYLGSANVMTGVNCIADFTGSNAIILSGSLESGQRITSTATDPLGNTSEFSACSGPTVADVIEFGAKSYESRVLLEWKTGFEVNNLGFRLYREEAGKQTNITPELVAASALMLGSGTELKAGQSYAWWDTSPADNRDVRYWLEDIDLSGQSTWHGPTTPQMIVGGPPPVKTSARLLTGLGRVDTQSMPIESRADLRTTGSARPKVQSGFGIGSVPNDLASHTAVKLSVKRAGWYRVTQSELIRAELDPKVDPRRLQLFVDGVQQPIAVIGESDGQFDPADAVEFYGVGLDSASTDTRVYWLVAGPHPGQRISILKSPGAPVWGGSFPFTIERKDRTIYFSALRNGDRENFFGQVIAGQPVNQSLNVLHLDPTTPAPAQLEVSLQGVTLMPHQVSVHLNGIELGHVSFNGQAQGEITLPVSTLLLKEGQNQVTLVSQGGPSDVSLIDRIRLTYSHTYTADNDVLKLTAHANEQLTLTGFSSSDIRVFDITDPTTVQEVKGKVAQTGKGYGVSLTVRASGLRILMALTDDRTDQVTCVAANSPSNWRKPGLEANMVIVTCGALFGAVDQLKTARERQGFSVAIVDVDDLYDEFSFGQKSPQAVRDFLSYARSNWKKPPRYALFAGDASYDPKNYLGFGDYDLVPTRLIDTAYMETASDDWFADFNSDGVPDLAVGRLPVRTSEEAAAMIAKIIEYDRSRQSDQMLLVSDANDGFDFEAASAQLAVLAPRDIRPQQIDRERLGDQAARTALIDAIIRGQRIVNYTGHGNATQWRGNLLTNEDAFTLENLDHLPVFVMMTCLNGYFHDPAIDSLAEALLKPPRGGAVAVWASSGMTPPHGQASMNQQLFRQLFNNTSMRLGDAVGAAKSAVSDPDVRRSWILMGDPTMRLR